MAFLDRLLLGAVCLSLLSACRCCLLVAVVVPGVFWFLASWPRGIVGRGGSWTSYREPPSIRPRCYRTQPGIRHKNPLTTPPPLLASQCVGRAYTDGHIAYQRHRFAFHEDRWGAGSHHRSTHMRNRRRPGGDHRACVVIADPRHGHTTRKDSYGAHHHRTTVCRCIAYTYDRFAHRYLCRLEKWTIGEARVRSSVCPA